MVAFLLCAPSAWAYFGGRYYAKMTGKASTTTTGSGKVYMSSSDEEAVSNWASKRYLDSYPDDAAWAAWTDDDSNVEYVGSIASADGIDVIASQFVAYAKADDGSYFAGWSFTDGCTDLGTDNTLGIKVGPSKTRAELNPEDTYGEDGETIETYGTVTDYKAKEYELFATFEPLLIERYTISGSTTTENRECQLTVTFRIAGKEVDENDFYAPTLIKKTGTSGTWAAGAFSVIDYSEYTEVEVPVTFTAEDDAPGEFSATLQLTTKAGKTMKVVLAARTTGGSDEAIRYNANKVEQGRGDLTAMIAAASSTDIIKLNNNYDSDITIGKSLTFDLNGFDCSGTLAITAGNVTVAFSPHGGTATALEVTGGKAILNGGTFGTLTIGASGTVEQNGAIVTDVAENNGTLTTTDGEFQYGLTSGGNLVVNGGIFGNGFDDWAIQVTGGNAQIKRGNIGFGDYITYYGIWASGGTVTIEKQAKIYGYTYALKNDGGTIIVENGQFDDPTNFAEGTVDFRSGYFKTNSPNESSILGKHIWRNLAGPEFRDGYVFFAGNQAAALASGVTVCHIDQAAFATLEDALDYVNNHPDDQAMIFMDNDYTLQAGYYTLPANATLIVPMSDDQQTANQYAPRNTGSTIAAPVSFRKLIFESGVNMEVLGTLELTCEQYGKQPRMGVPGGNFGHLIMKPGSHMTINRGGELRAWGYVSGDGTKDGDNNYLSGEIDARRGSIVREMFQMGDWKGGDISLTMIYPKAPQNMTHLFPIYTYFIQNIESPVKYHPGSALLCAASVNVASGINAFANDIKVVGKQGEAAMFLMDEKADAENTWVRKYYDAKHDQQVYEINSGAKLGSLVIDLGEVPAQLFGGTGKYRIVMDSRKYVLPLTSNFKIHLLSGSMQFTQSTSCLPGMEVEVDKESEISIIPSDDAEVLSGALYFYDADQWSFDNQKLGGYVGIASESQKYGRIVSYSATWDLGTNGTTKKPNVRNVNSPEAIGDAKLIVHGTFRSARGCSVYTTWSKGTGTTDEDNPYTLNPSGTGGASITSTNADAGTFIFDDDSPAFDGVHWKEGGTPGNINDLEGFGNSVLVNYDNNNYGNDNYPIQITLVKDNTPSRMFGWELCTPAMLKNGDGTFAVTEGTQAGKSYCYMNDRWTLMEVAEENECFMKDNYGTFYAKPAEYVAVAATVDGNGDVVGNDDHTFSDKAGAGRLFILMDDDCQWWEVENKENLYHCIHPNNDTYYYWDEGESKWKEKRYTITWKNWDGSEIKSYTYNPVTGEPTKVAYSVTYGTMAEYLGSSPTREADVDYTYSFTGWSPALGRVTSDVTYTATYSKQVRKYTVIFLNEGGVEIERHLLPYDAIPVCENTPTQAGHLLEWEPALVPVTGDQTYRATWLPEPPTEWDVTFVNNAGGVLQATAKVSVTAHPSYSGATPVKENADHTAYSSDEYEYTFKGWSAVIDGEAQEFAPSDVLPCPTHATTYAAVYEQAAKTYEVKFYNESATSVIKTENLAFGATPTPPAVEKENPEAGHTYTLVWKTLDGSATIENVTGVASYKPTYIDVVNRYKVTLVSNPSGVCTFAGAGTYDYNTLVTIAAIPADGYEFEEWQETGITDATLDPQQITDDITLTAVLKVASVDPEDLTLGIDAVETVASLTDYKDVTITSDGVEHSSQIINGDNIILHGNANFVLQKHMDQLHWYDIAVPWRVDADGGIFLGSSGAPAVLGQDIELYYYDGDIRAAQGKVDACWIAVKEQSSKVLEPGRAYLFLLYKSAVESVTFRMKAGKSILTLTTSVVPHASGNAIDAGWNGIANPSLFHAYLNAGAEEESGHVYGQMINAAGDGYEPFDMMNSKLVVGQPIYVQAPAAKTVEANSTSYDAAPAPARHATAQARPVSYDLTITAEGAARHADRIIIQLNENKQKDGYVIGQDLAKFGVGTQSAQWWIDRYDTKLCVNTVAPQNETAEFPLTVFAPKAGAYTMAVERMTASGDDALYLTYDGVAVWNLSNGAYTADLQEGTDTHYGLRTVAKKPNITTGVDEAVVDHKDASAIKVLIDNQVYIIRGEKVYSIDGQWVK